ncbi:class I SAM-dependent methyltransferase [Kitasatospora sp. NPDC057692]|uniref:class I SAM-dependent methyltransferase n=1 Tax=Kitasatospora sp. NPDC057692 TaxID=3346215 RepID=UPI0036B9990F
MNHHTDRRAADRGPSTARGRTDTWAFLREAVRDLRTTGAVAPSGKALARTVTDPIRVRAPRPLSVLEAGAGTGAITRALLPQLPHGSRLDLVEANPRFVARLHELLDAHPAPPARNIRVTVHQTYVEDLDTDRRYDVIVSALPLTNFAPDRVERIMARYLDLLLPGGTLSSFAYLGTRRARTLLASRAEARRHAAVDAITAAYRHRYATGRWTVLANLPPAHVWELRRPEVTGGRTGEQAGDQSGGQTDDQSGARR